jgi:hypothetical protein
MAQASGYCNSGLLFSYPSVYGYLYSKATCSGTPSSVTDYSTCHGGKMFKAGVAIPGTPSGGGDERNPTSAPTPGVVHLVGDVTLSNIDYSLLSTEDINDLVNGAKSSLRQLLNIDSSYIEVTVSRGSRRRLLRRLDSAMDLALDLSATLLAQFRANHLNTEEKSETAETDIITTAATKITPATTPSDTVVIHFTIDAVSTYLTSLLGIYSTSTVAVISNIIENKIASGSGSSFKYYLQLYVNSYGTTSLKNSVANSNYQSASVAEKSSDDSSSDSVEVPTTLIIAVVVGVVGGIAVCCGLIIAIYFCTVRHNASKPDELFPDNKMGTVGYHNPNQAQPQVQQSFQPVPQQLGTDYQPVIANPYPATVEYNNSSVAVVAVNDVGVELTSKY